jgi:ribosomal protein S18 acetylase RimI-like enzyme
MSNSKPETIIRPAKITDATPIVAIIAAMDYQATAPEVEARLKNILSHPDHLLVVAETNNQVVGFCHGYIRSLIEVPAAVEIGGLSVLHKWQQRGIAKQLVSYIEAWAISQKVGRVVLSSNIIRTGAHGFYEHIGYKKIKQQFAFEKIVSNQ